MPYVRASQYSTVTDTSQKFAAAMVTGQTYRFSATVDCYVAVAATGGSASAAANNHIYIKGQTLYLGTGSGDASTNYFVHVIRIGATSGTATLSVVEGL